MGCYSPLSPLGFCRRAVLGVVRLVGEVPDRLEPPGRRATRLKGAATAPQDVLRRLRLDGLRPVGRLIQVLVAAEFFHDRAPL